jgi:hypothetical protein
MLIHIDRRRMLREFQATVGNLSGPNPSRNVVQYPIPTGHSKATKTAITTLAKINLNGATSRRYANSIINHIFVWNVFQGRAARLIRFSGPLFSGGRSWLPAPDKGVH